MPREKFMDRIKKITGLGTTTEVFRLTSDRDAWKKHDRPSIQHAWHLKKKKYIIL